MTLEDLEKIKGSDTLSGEAQDVIDAVLDELEGESPSDDDIKEFLWENINDMFMLLYSAYEYLEEQEIDEFTEAIRDGARTPQQIAGYYLEREIYEAGN